MEFRTINARLGSGRRLSVSCALSAFAALASSATASAQTPAINMGHGIELRLENSANYDSGSPVGQTKLVFNTLLDTDSQGPFVVTLEQGGRVLATGSCDATAVVYSGELQPGEGYLRECVTSNVPSASIRTNAPVDVVLAIVNDATDARTELYRGTFPVIGFTDWTGMQDDRPIHIEQRALRLDSMYGVGFVRQYIGQEIEFSYVSTQNTGSFPDDTAMRCRVGTGEWTAYTTSTSTDSQQTARNRVWDNGTVHEDGNETIVTQFVHFSVRMPIAVPGRSRTPDAGASLDGAWTCEFRTGGAGTRVVQREFRFDVRNGYIQPNAIESQVRPGRGAVLTSIGFNPEAMPMIFDPALVRDSVAGRPLNGATAPVVAGMPARASQPALTAPRGASPAAGARGTRRR